MVGVGCVDSIYGNLCVVIGIIFKIYWIGEC